MVLVVQDLADGKCFDLSYTHYQVTTYGLKTNDQYLIICPRQWSTYKEPYLAGCQCEEVKLNESC